MIRTLRGRVAIAAATALTLGSQLLTPPGAEALPSLPSISFTSTAPTTAPVGGTYTPTATVVGSILSPYFLIDGQTTNNACTVFGATVTFRHAGLCVVGANVLGSGSLQPLATQSIVVGKTAQAISFVSGAPLVAVAGGLPYLPLTLGGASGNAVILSVGAGTTNNACSVTGNVVSLLHVGTCVIDANQAGDSDYLPAPTVSQTFPVVSSGLDPILAPIISSLGLKADIGVPGALRVTVGAGDTVTVGVGTGTTNNACSVTPTDDSGLTKDYQVLYLHAGTCVISVHTLLGTYDQTVEVGTKSQSITVTTTAPIAATVGGSYTPNATAPGGSVTYSVSGGACSLSAGVVTFERAGSCIVKFNQSGSIDFDPAAQLQQSIPVAVATSSVSIANDNDHVVYGATPHVAATVTASSGTTDGTVQFSVDGDDLGTPVTVVDGRATSPALTGAASAALHAGLHGVAARFTPADGTLLGSSGNATTLVVGQAATTTEVAVSASQLTATVATTATGAGQPAGSVTFSVGGVPVGTATLVDGVARLQHTVPTASDAQVAAVFAGSTNFAASSGSTNRNNPSITATVAGEKNATGWYRGRVTVTFACSTAGAPLTAPCPAPVVVTAEGQNSVSRTVTAVDGGVATVVVSRIDIDNTAPAVSVTGARAGGVYHVAPRMACSSKDTVSGAASCTMKQRSTPIAAGKIVHYWVTATDKAGNSHTVKGTYTLLTRYIVEAKYRKGAFDVKRGRVYTLVVTSSKSRPTFYSIARGRPHTHGHVLRAAGKHRWSIRFGVGNKTRAFKYWHIGVKDAQGTHNLTLRVSK